MRTEIRRRRRALAGSVRQAADRAINQAIIELVENTGIASLSGFRSFDGEPDLRPALELLSGRGLHIALPVIAGTAAARRLQFRAWHPATPLQKNSFGIEEPAGNEIVPPRDLDLVLLPLVAWDERGNRLGMGAGYYDRALAAVAGHRRPLRVGIAYGLQQVDQLPADPWDVRMHQVITENGRFTCSA